MVWQLLVKECRLQWRERRFQVSLLVLAALALPAVALALLHLQADELEVAAGGAAERERWVAQGAKNPHSAAHYGLYVFRPVAPLRVWDQGITPFAGSVVFTEAHLKNDASYESVQQQSGLARFGLLTPVFVALYLVPLFLMLNGFAAISGEREQGTLRLLRAAGIDSRRLLAAKWLSLMVPVAVAPVLLLAPGWVWLWGRLPLSELIAAALLSLLILSLYYGAIAAVTLLVSLASRASHQALVACILFWTLSCLLVPKLAAGAAERWFPSPDRAAFHEAMQREKKAGMDGHDPSDARAERLRQQILAEYGVDRVEDLPINLDGVLMQEDENYGNQVFDRHHAELRAVHRRQERVFLAASLVSPFLAARLLTMAVTGTDGHTQARFNQAVEHYRRDYVALLNNDLTEQSRSGEWQYKADERLWSQVPNFVFDFGSASARLQARRWVFVVLAGWFVSVAALLLGFGPRLLQREVV